MGEKLFSALMYSPLLFPSVKWTRHILLMSLSLPAENWWDRNCKRLRLPKTSAVSGEGSGTHSSALAWKIPWTEEPGGLQSMGSRRVRHDWVTSLSLFSFMPWRRQWQPTPVFLPEGAQGRGSLAGCRLWGRTESGTTERLHFHFSVSCLGEGNGTPLQRSCLENPRDGGACGLPPMGPHRVGHDWRDLAAAAVL